MSARLTLDRLLAIFDSLDYHIAIYDREWRFTYVNAEAARLVGRPADELLGRSIWALFPEAVGNQYYRELHEAAASGRAIHSDHFYAPFRRWFENHIYPLPDGVMVLARDVTREREGSEQLRQREQMLRLAQRAGGVATFEWDFRNQMAQCSAEFFRIFGLPAEDGRMSGADWGRFVHPEDRERMTVHLQRALAGEEPPSADYRIIAADGSTRWLTYAGQLQKTAGGDRLLGTVLDITDRKGLEAELRESRDVLAMAMRAGSMGAWSLSGDTMWWSPELEDIVGLRHGAFAGTKAAFYELLHPEDLDRVRTTVAEALQRGTDYAVEFRYRHASGHWRWMEGRGRAAYTAARTPPILYGIAADVTARKQAEIALQDAKVAAESANRLKDQFLATLSHELRTPLNAILGYARMLRTEVIAPDKRQHAVEVIERNADAQKKLVEDLLDMSRITTGKLRLDPAPVPLADIVREAVEGLKPAADAKRVTLDLDLEADAHHVRGDAARLQQVFWNLLSNAVKFTGAGGRVVVRVRADGGDVEIAVQDTGVGIAPEFVRSIFEPFRQGDATRVGGHGGLGLGLAISKQLVELHGGTISAASGGAGDGATFTVRLPRLSGASAPALGSQAAAERLL